MFRVWGLNMLMLVRGIVVGVTSTTSANGGFPRQLLSRLALVDQPVHRGSSRG